MVVYVCKYWIVVGALAMFFSLTKGQAIPRLLFHEGAQVLRQAFPGVMRSAASPVRFFSQKMKEEKIRAEKVDILDAMGNRTGQVVSRTEAREKSLFHGVVRACPLSEDLRHILLQRRSSSTTDFAGKWALTAGHCWAGETHKEAMERELKEELGVNVPPQALHYQGWSREEGERFYIVNHYIAILPREGTFVWQVDEVEAAKFVPIMRVLKNPERYFGADLAPFYKSDLLYLGNFMVTARLDRF
jgi:ADP-ribose pyrophosphatase YjhB (NUDIX family)